MARIFIELRLDEKLSVDQVWPDGDAPETVDAQAVVEAMESCGSKSVVLSDWNLLPDVEVTVVDGNGKRTKATWWTGGW